MLLFAIGALRAIVEMLGLCLIAQGVLYVVAGQGRATNPIYQLFSVVTAPPRKLLSRLLPVGTSGMTNGVICLALLFMLWAGLAILRKFI